MMEPEQMFVLNLEVLYEQRIKTHKHMHINVFGKVMFF